MLSTARAETARLARPRTRLRVLFVVDYFPSSSETFVVNQVGGLLDRGLEVAIYAERRGKPGPLPEVIARYGLLDRVSYRASVGGSRLDRARRLLPRLARSVRQNPRLVLALDPRERASRADRLRAVDLATWLAEQPPFDLVHGHFAHRAIPVASLKAAGALRRPLVVTFHGYDANVYPRAVGLDCYRTLFRVGEAFTVGSSFMRERVVALGAEPAKVSVLPMGVFEDAFVPPAPEGKVVLGVGRLVEVKGFEWGVRAMAPLLRRDPALIYRVAGEGPERPRLEALAAELGVARQVELVGALSPAALRREYQRATVFLMSGTIARDGGQEGQGLVLAEAQAASLPVVGTRVGGIPECVREGETALLAADRDVEALGRHVALLLDDPARRAEMGAAARGFVAAEFHQERLVDRLVELYERLTERRETHDVSTHA